MLHLGSEDGPCIPAELRPDKSGIMFDLRRRAPGEFEGLVKPEYDRIVSVFELREGAAQAHAEFIDSIAEVFPLLVVSAGGTKLTLWQVPQVKVQCDWNESIAEFQKRLRAEGTAAHLSDDHEEEESSG
jgi:hypothetical protein